MTIIPKGFLAIILGFLIAGCASDHVPITKSEARLREAFLDRYRIGMQIEEFRDLMAKSRIRIYQEWDRPVGNSTLSGRPALGGDRVLWVDLGMYQSLPNRVYVSAFVSFANGRLVDCTVRKSNDPY
jgi:hypothetical protein